MPDRRPPNYACEENAREALLAARARTDALGADSTGPSCLSLRWRRSGGAGFLLIPPVGVAGAGCDPVIHWIPLQDGAQPSGAPDEWRLHRDLYRLRDDVDAIVRCRPAFATTLACSTRLPPKGVPAFHPDLPLAAGAALVRVDCGLPGTMAGSKSGSMSGSTSDSTLRSEPLLAALEGSNSACLLAGWGLLACGASLPVATARAAEVEALARIWWHLLQLDSSSAARPEGR